MDSRPPWQQQQGGGRFDPDDDDELDDDYGPPPEATMSFPTRFTERLPRPSGVEEEGTTTRLTGTVGRGGESTAGATAAGEDGNGDGDSSGSAATYTTPLRYVGFSPCIGKAMEEEEV